ncbi:MAG: ATP-dependent DNA helicase [Euryarchaeota archaeon]|nr:ATP-dependent DNA helicase [Euryarchaeota archaeon]
MRLFPYVPRPGQEEMMTLFQRAVESEAHVVVEAGTGMGKTVCALTGVFEAALPKAKRILYLTRTNSQAVQVIREFRAIRERAGLPIHAVALQGRRNLCLLADEEREFDGADAEELAKMCRDRKRGVEEAHRVGDVTWNAGPGSARQSPGSRDQWRTARSTGGNDARRPFRSAGSRLGDSSSSAARLTCRFYGNMWGRSLDGLEDWARSANPTGEEVVAAARREGVCPYEFTKLLLKDASLVVAPYAYFFHPELRRSLLSWTGGQITDFVVVVDEAHNLPDYARDILTYRLSRGSIDHAMSETRSFGDLEVLEGVPLTRLLAELRSAIEELADGSLVEEDAPVADGDFEAMLLSRLRTTTVRLREAIKRMLDFGESIRERKRKQGKLPRSYIHSAGSFLESWLSLADEAHVKLITRSSGGPELTAACLDPSLVTRSLLEAHASIHMSGTLRPLEEYRDSIGLPPNTPLLSIPSPFPAVNRLAIFARDVSTKHEEVARDPQAASKLANRINGALRAAGRSCAVFFPSYDLLERVAPSLDLTVSLAERRAMTQGELMGLVTEFRSKRGRALLGVIGGRLSEGMDFPADELEMVVVVGLPYPKPSFRLKALENYYDAKFGRGFEYAVEAPMKRRLLQAAGRLIRSETDRGVLLILDRRAERLAGDIQGLHASLDPDAEVRGFFESRHANRSA